MVLLLSPLRLKSVLCKRGLSKKRHSRKRTQVFTNSDVIYFLIISDLVCPSRNELQMNLIQYICRWLGDAVFGVCRWLGDAVLGVVTNLGGVFMNKEVFGSL